MRIGIFDPYMDTPSGGEKYMLFAASCLSQSHEVDLFWNDPSVLSFCSQRFDVDLSKIKTVKNIFSNDTRIWEKLSVTKKYDAIFYLSDGSIPFTLCKKLILHMQFPMQWVNGKSILTQLKLRRVYTIITNSQFTKQSIDKTYNTNSIVVYPPASGHYPEFSAKTKKKNTILTVGRLGILPNGKTFKKQEVMIDVFKKMISHGLKGWEFNIVVSFQKKDEDLFKILEKKADGYLIRFLKNVSSQDLYLSYRDAKIYWHAAGFGEDLVHYPELAEHFGISTVEAMEQGEIPIVVNAGGQAEIVNDGEDGFLWNTTEELANKTMNIINQPSLMEKIGEKARDRAKYFSETLFCQKLHNIFES